MRRAQQQGVEIPWYRQQMAEDTQGDLPWLDPFSVQPGMASQAAQGQQNSSMTGEPSASQTISEQVLLTSIETPIVEQPTSCEPTLSSVDQDGLLLSSQVVAYEQPSPLFRAASMESWTTPKMSRSTSVTTELMQSPRAEVEAGNCSMAKNTSALNAMKNLSFDATLRSPDEQDICDETEKCLSHCVSTDIGDEGAMLQPILSTTDLANASGSVFRNDSAWEGEPLSVKMLVHIDSRIDLREGGEFSGIQCGNDSSSEIDFRTPSSGEDGGQYEDELTASAASFEYTEDNEVFTDDSCYETELIVDKYQPVDTSLGLDNSSSYPESSTTDYHKTTFIGISVDQPQLEHAALELDGSSSCSESSTSDNHKTTFTGISVDQSQLDHTALELDGLSSCSESSIGDNHKNEFVGISVDKAPPGDSAMNLDGSSSCTELMSTQSHDHETELIMDKTQPEDTALELDGSSFCTESSTSDDHEVGISVDKTPPRDTVLEQDGSSSCSESSTSINHETELVGVSVDKTQPEDAALELECSSSSSGGSHSTCDILQAGDNEHLSLHQMESTLQNVQSVLQLGSVETTGDEIQIVLETDDNDPCFYDNLSNKMTVTMDHGPISYSQCLSRSNSPADRENLESNSNEQILSSKHSSQSQSNPRRSEMQLHPQSVQSISSLPNISLTDESHSYPPSPPRSVGSKLSNHIQSRPMRNDSETINNAHSIQLSQVSNQSRSSGNQSLTFQTSKHSNSSSGPELSSHFQSPPSLKSDRNGSQPSEVVSYRSRSSGTHSLTSQTYKYSDSGSSISVYTKTEETTSAAVAPLSGKHVSPTCCSTCGSSESNINFFDKVVETTLKGLPDQCSEQCAMDVFTVDMEHDLTCTSANPMEGQFGHTQMLCSSGQESLGLHHSKPTFNLADECSDGSSLPGDGAFQASDSIALQLEVPDILMEVSWEKSGGPNYPGQDQQLLGVTSQPQYLYPTNCGTSESKYSQEHVALTIDSDEHLDVINSRLSALSGNNTNESSSGVSHCSTDYYTALESLDFSSESSMGVLCHGGNQADGYSSEQSAAASLDRGSEHRDSVQVKMEPVNSTNLLKMSSSASLFIPRGFSTGPLSLSGHSSQQRGSTSTLYSILGQLSESSVSDKDQQVVDLEPNQTVHVYEPY